MRTRVVLVVFAIAYGMAVSAAFAATPASPAKVKSRAVSLRALQAALRAVKTQPDPALLTLCGLTRLDGYTWDRKQRDLILLGRVDPAEAPLYTEDFVVALRNAARRYVTKQGASYAYAYPGCSIDLDPAVVRKLSDLGAQLGKTQGGPAAEEVLAKWEEAAKSPQHVRVLGVPATSHFAEVMVHADYYLKALADGSASSGVPELVGLPDLLLAQTKEELRDPTAPRTPMASFNRFWFFPGRNQFVLDEDTVTLEDCPVQLLTEEQYLTKSGVAGLGKPSALAAQFAQTFTVHFEEIAQAKPIYDQLRSLFRFFSLAQAMRYQRVDVDLDSLLDRFPVMPMEVPKEVPGRSRVVRLTAQGQTVEVGAGQGYVVIPSCGGVTMDLKVDSRNFRRVTHPATPTQQAAGKAPVKGKAVAKAKAPATPKRNAAAARPSPNALYWDY